MDRYYYFVSTLPALRFNTKPNIVIADFLCDARKWLVPNDIAVLDALVEGQYGQVINKRAGIGVYLEFVRRVTGQIAAWRKDKSVGVDADIKRILDSDFNPLEREIALLKARWLKLEELECDNYFNGMYVFIYYCKLEILRRVAMFDKEIGKKKFNEICEVDYDKKISDSIN